MAYSKLKSIAICIALTVTNPVVWLSTFLWIQVKEDRELRERIEKKDLPTIINLQENKLGIKHYGVPNVGFFSGHYIGSYDAEEDSIGINYDLLGYPMNEKSRLCSTLHHELGHFYCDKRSEALGIGNWPRYKDKSNGKQAGLRTVSEGIAEYFARLMTSQVVDDFNDEQYPKSLDDFFVNDNGKHEAINENIIYNGGYHLVKPILDIDCKQGIDCLILNPPNEDEALNLPNYRNRILKLLE